MHKAFRDVAGYRGLRTLGSTGRNGITDRDRILQGCIVVQDIRGFRLYGFRVLGFAMLGLTVCRLTMTFGLKLSRQGLEFRFNVLGL